MRKFCALGITTFYLLLTTGVYACLLHCTTEYLSLHLGTVPEIHQSDQDHGKGHEKDDDDDCRSGDCDCCYHHGVYVVKENFSSAFDFQFSIVHAAIIPLNKSYFIYTPEIVKNPVTWPRATGPPFLFSEPLYISNRTLLI